jgi:hypothetical protein
MLQNQKFLYADMMSQVENSTADLMMGCSQNTGALDNTVQILCLAMAAILKLSRYVYANIPKSEKNRNDSWS